MDRKTQSRLKQDLVIWLGTAARDAQPHATLVWFWWDGKSFLIYSVPGQKVRDIEANPNVELHLNSDPAGEEMVRATGTAKLLKKHVPAHKVPAYLRKYRHQIKGFGWTPQYFSEKYHIAIRVQQVRFR